MTWNSPHLDISGYFTIFPITKKMMPQFLFSTISRAVVFYCLLSVLAVLVGCTDKSGESTTPPEDSSQSVGVGSPVSPMGPAGMIPFNPVGGKAVPQLSATDIASLGEKNDLDLKWMFTDGFFGIVARPQRFVHSTIGNSAQELINQFFLGYTFGLPIPFDTADEIQVAMKRDVVMVPVQNGQAIFEQPVPVMSQVVVVRFSDSVTEQDRLRQLFPQVESLDSIPKATFGGVPCYDLTMPVGPNSEDLSPLRIAFHLAVDAKTLVFCTGPKTAVDEVFLQRTAGSGVGGVRGKGALVERMQRLPLNELDIAIVLTFEGTTGEVEQLEPMLQGVAGISPALRTALATGSRAAMVVWNTSAAENSPTAVATLFARDSAIAAELRKQISGSVLMFKSNLATVRANPDGTPAETSETPAVSPAQKLAEMSPFAAGMEFASQLLGAIKVEAKDTQVVATLTKFPNMDETVAAWFRNIISTAQEAMRQEQEYEMKMAVLEDVAATVGRISNAMLEYHQQYDEFPPVAITAADGSPLLSWRVSILPFLGEETKTLYEQFHLDEPWDSPNNKPLLYQMPPIFADIRMAMNTVAEITETTDTTMDTAADADMAAEPVAAEMKQMTTTIRLFTTPDTVPFGRRPLKMSDIPDPGRAIMLVAVSPKNAVPWTQPDTLELQAENLSSLFEGVVPMATFGGQFFFGQFDPGPLENNAQRFEELSRLFHLIQDR